MWGEQQLCSDHSVRHTMVKSSFKKKNFAVVINFVNIESACLGYLKKKIPHRDGTIRQYKVIIVMSHWSLTSPW